MSDAREGNESRNGAESTRVSENTMSSQDTSREKRTRPSGLPPPVREEAMDFMCEDTDEDGQTAYPWISDDAKGKLADEVVVLAYVPITMDSECEFFVLPGWTSTTDDVQSVVFFQTTLWQRLGVAPQDRVLVGETRLRRAVGIVSAPQSRPRDGTFASLFRDGALMHKVSECIDHLYETNDGFRAALDKSKSSHQGIVGEVKWP